jgi:hypothetical protein
MTKKVNVDVYVGKKYIGFVTADVDDDMTPEQARKEVETIIKKEGLKGKVKLKREKHGI